MIGEYYSFDSLSVRFYDAITGIDPAIRGDVEFYATYLGAEPRSVLELGCGTGRVAMALAAQGHLVVGVDRSEAMLNRARMNCRHLPLWHRKNVQFLNGDITTIELPLQFYAVAVPFYTFNHLENRNVRAKALAIMAKHLKPGGVALIHAAGPESLRERIIPRRPGNVLIFEGINLRLEVTWQRTINEARRTSIQDVEYQLFSGDGVLLRSSTERLTYYWFTDREIERSAARVGLQLEQKLTSFSVEPGREGIYVFRRSGVRS
jgi:SAM-dependent methyltransferase